MRRLHRYRSSFAANDAVLKFCTVDPLTLFHRNPLGSGRGRGLCDRSECLHDNGSPRLQILKLITIKRRLKTGGVELQRQTCSSFEVERGVSSWHVCACGSAATGLHLMHFLLRWCIGTRWPRCPKEFQTIFSYSLNRHSLEHYRE